MPAIVSSTAMAGVMSFCGMLVALATYRPTNCTPAAFMPPIHWLIKTLASRPVFGGNVAMFRLPWVAGNPSTISDSEQARGADEGPASRGGELDAAETVEAEDEAVAGRDRQRRDDAAGDDDHAG